MRTGAAFLLLTLLAPPGAAAESPDFVPLVRAEAAAVVSVTGVYRQRPVLPDMPLAEDAEPDEDAFVLLVEPGVPAEGPSLGAGFFISEDGYVLTSAHLVAGGVGHDVRVRLADQREFEARVVGADALSDIALLKVDARRLPRVRIGDPARLQPGEWVAAIGSPFGMQQSVSAGIVSATRRTLPGEGPVPFIQTDVALNPGNSGGPLFNLRGEVVGVNSVIFTATGGYTGISFAIPIDAAMRVAAELRARGKVTRGHLGVRLQGLTPELARAFGLAGAAGALVVDVSAGGPAQRAGLQPADVVVSFAGRKVATDVELMRLAAEAKPGAQVELEVVRERLPLRMVALMEEAPGAAPRAAIRSAGVDETGLRLAPLSPAQRARLGVSKGLLVQRAEGAAQRAGIAAGDLVLSLNGQPIDTVQAFRAMVESAGPDAVLAVLLQRGGARLFVPLRVPG